MRLTSSDLLSSLGHLGDCLYKPANIFNSETVKICFIRFASVNISRNSSTEYPFHLVVLSPDIAIKLINASSYPSFFLFSTASLWLSLSSDTLFSFPILLRISIDSSSKLAMTSSGKNYKMFCWLVVSTFSSVSLFGSISTLEICLFFFKAVAIFWGDPKVLTLDFSFNVMPFPAFLVYSKQRKTSSIVSILRILYISSRYCFFIFFSIF